MTQYERYGKKIESEIEIQATPEACYQAFADPEAIARWFVDKASGRGEVGQFVTWSFEDFGYHIPYEVIAAEPGKHFALGFSMPGRTPGVFEVFFQKAGGGTRVRLVNYGFHDGAECKEEYEGVVSGWKMALATLRHQLERYPGRDRSSFLAMAPAAFDYADMPRWFRSEAGLATWLTKRGALGAEGSRCELELRDGRALACQVLAHTGWETLISWDAERAVLGLKAFGMGPMGRRIAIHGSGWGWTPQRAQEMKASFAPAVERLAARLKASPVS